MGKRVRWLPTFFQALFQQLCITEHTSSCCLFLDLCVSFLWWNGSLQEWIRRDQGHVLPDHWVGHPQYLGSAEPIDQFWRGFRQIRELNDVCVVWGKLLCIWKLYKILQFHLRSSLGMQWCEMINKGKISLWPQLSYRLGKNVDDLGSLLCMEHKCIMSSQRLMDS